MLPHLRTHLLVSCSCWIFLCSLKLWAPHADNLHEERENEQENKDRNLIFFKILLWCYLACPPFLSLPIWVCWLLSQTPFCHPGTPPLSSSAVSLVWFSHCESIMHSTDNDTLLIRAAWIWFNYQQMLTLGETISPCHETFVIRRQQSSSSIEMLIACN